MEQANTLWRAMTRDQKLDFLLTKYPAADREMLNALLLLRDRGVTPEIYQQAWDAYGRRET